MRNTGHRILAEGQTASNDTWTTGRNNNDLIIGPSGAGKTRGYVLPNILQCSESMIVTDTKNTLCQEVAGMLIQHGYRVLEVNLTDCLTSPWGYNPLDYVRYDRRRGKYSEQDIITIAAALVPIENGHEPFWDLAARMVLESLIGYVLDFLPDEEHTLSSVVKLFQVMGSKQFKRLYDELKEVAPDSFAYARYQMFRSISHADKMYASIQGILAQKLSPLTFDGTKALFDNPQRIDFRTLDQRKTAVFLGISDTDRSMDRLAALFYTQALHTLCNIADHSPGHRLAVPVRLILDDFAANAAIPDFDKITSVIRSREISVSIIIQSLSQLEALYGHAKALTIINNCDDLLYLGGQDVETARYISTKANKSINTILQMPLDSAWLFTRGEKPQEVRKYRLDSHPLYRERDRTSPVLGEMEAPSL